jgi:hypothetical protein
VTVTDDAANDKVKVKVGGKDFINLAHAPYGLSSSQSAAANLQGLIDALAASGASSTKPGRKLYLPGRAGLVPISGVWTPASPALLVGDGPESSQISYASNVGSGGAGRAVEFSAFKLGSTGTNNGGQAVSANVARGDTVITGITSTAAWAAGDWLILRVTGAGGTVPGSTSGGRYGERVKIRSIDSATQITLVDGARGAYSTANSIFLTKVTPWVGAGIDGVGFVNTTLGLGFSNQNSDMVTIRGVDEAAVDVGCWNLDGAGVCMDACWDSEVYVIARDGSDTDTGGASGTQQLQSYGLLMWNGCEGLDIHIDAARVRHGFTTGATWMGIPRDCRIHAKTYECTGAHIDTHGDGEYLTFIAPQARRSKAYGYTSSGAYGIQVRAPRCTILGGNLDDTLGWAIYIGSTSGVDCRIIATAINGVRPHALESSAGGVYCNAAGLSVRNLDVAEHQGGTAVALTANAPNWSIQGLRATRPSGVTTTAPVNINATATSGYAAGIEARGGYTAALTGTTANATQPTGSNAVLT